MLLRLGELKVGILEVATWESTIQPVMMGDFRRWRDRRQG
jgi:hypothetical protein